jgi:hypothetical protein
MGQSRCWDTWIPQTKSQTAHVSSYATATRSSCECKRAQSLQSHCWAMSTHVCSFHHSCFPVRRFLGRDDWFLDSSDQDVQGFWAWYWYPSLAMWPNTIWRSLAAYKDKNTLIIGVADSSSIHIALFVLPFTVMLGWTMNIASMTLYFDIFQMTIVFVAVFAVTCTIQDGKSHW